MLVAEQIARESASVGQQTPEDLSEVPRIIESLRLESDRNYLTLKDLKDGGLNNPDQLWTYLKG